MRDIIIIGNSSLAFSSGSGLQASQALDTDSWGLQEGDSEAGGAWFSLEALVADTVDMCMCVIT